MALRRHNKLNDPELGKVARILPVIPKDGYVIIDTRRSRKDPKTFRDVLATIEYYTADPDDLAALKRKLIGEAVASNVFYKSVLNVPKNDMHAREESNESASFKIIPVQGDEPDSESVWAAFNAAYGEEAEAELLGAVGNAYDAGLFIIPGIIIPNGSEFAIGTAEQDAAIQRLLDGYGGNGA